MAKLFANSGDPDQTPRSAASDLGLHCLPITLLRVSRLQWVKDEYFMIILGYFFFFYFSIKPYVVLQKIIPEILPNTVEPQWLEHLWDHGNSFETWVVSAIEC